MIPALDYGAEGVHHDGEVEDEGLVPAVGLFPLQSEVFVTGEFGEGGWGLGYEGGFEEDGKVGIQAVGLDKGIDVGEELVIWDSVERVLDRGGGFDAVSSWV